MDIRILFYDVDSGTISTRYLDSHFVFHLNSNVLYGEKINSIKDLDSSRVILGMDGHNVNWCVFDKIMQREKNIIMLHFSMLAVIVACIRSMVPLRQA